MYLALVMSDESLFLRGAKCRDFDYLWRAFEKEKRNRKEEARLKSKAKTRTLCTIKSRLGRFKYLWRVGGKYKGESVCNSRCKEFRRVDVCDLEDVN